MDWHHIERSQTGAHFSLREFAKAVHHVLVVPNSVPTEEIKELIVFSQSQLLIVANHTIRAMTTFGQSLGVSGFFSFCLSKIQLPVFGSIFLLAINYNVKKQYVIVICRMSKNHYVKNTVVLVFSYCVRDRA